MDLMELYEHPMYHDTIIKIRCTRCQRKINVEVLKKLVFIVKLDDERKD